MTIRYQRAPGTLRIERLELAREAPLPQPPPLPMRADRAASAPTPSYHQRVMAVVAPRRPVAVSRLPRVSARVTGAQLRRARQLKRLSQWELAPRLACSRSAIAEAERGFRKALPNVEEWVEAVLREHGEWDEPEGGATP